MINRQLKIDFRTKLLMTLVLPLVLMIGNLPGKNLLIAMIVSFFPCLLMLLAGKVKEALSGVFWITLAILAQKYLFGLDLGFMNAFVMLFIMTLLRMLPGFLMAKYALTTTDMSEVISSLKKMHLPDAIVIPITVMARFFYTVSIDYKQIKDAMYIDGLTTSRLLIHPVKFVEYRIIPLLMVLTRTADEVSTSALCRGLEINKQRSSVYDNKFKIIDLICLILMVLTIYLTWGVTYA